MQYINCFFSHKQSLTHQDWLVLDKELVLFYLMTSCVLALSQPLLTVTTEEWETTTVLTLRMPVSSVQVSIQQEVSLVLYMHIFS